MSQTHRAQATAESPVSAAAKSFVPSVIGGLAMPAAWQRDKGLSALAEEFAQRVLRRLAAIVRRSLTDWRPRPHLMFSGEMPVMRLSVVAPLHPMLDPLLHMVSFGSFIEALAHRLGLHPETPRHLRKITETV